jgi:hypothetical protein
MHPLFLNVGLHAIAILGLRAVVILGLRVVVVAGLCAIVNVGHRALLLQVLETSPCRGGATQILNLYSRVSSFAEQDLPEGRRRDLGDPDRVRRRHGSACTASPRHCVDSPLPR